MDLSNFVEKAKELNVLGVKVSQNGGTHRGVVQRA